MKDEFKRARPTRHWMGRKREAKKIGNRWARRRLRRETIVRVRS